MSQLVSQEPLAGGHGEPVTPVIFNGEKLISKNNQLSDHVFGISSTAVLEKEETEKESPLKATTSDPTALTGSPLIPAKDSSLLVDSPLPQKNGKLPHPESESVMAAKEVAVTKPSREPSQVIEYDEVIGHIDHHLSRLGWTKEDGKNYLIKTYGKKSRQLLSDDELIEFWEYLRNLSSTEQR